VGLNLDALPHTKARTHLAHHTTEHLQPKLSHVCTHMQGHPLTWLKLQQPTLTAAKCSDSF
jgi:hypothetical protein